MRRKLAYKRFAGGALRSLLVASSLMLSISTACSGARDPGSAAQDDLVDGQAWFVDRRQDSGIDFQYVSGADGDMHLPEVMGGGVALLDFDADGDLDIYATNGGYNPVSGAPQPELTNRLFRNDGAWRFSDATQDSGLGDRGYGMGVATGDVDADGDVDVYLTNYGADALYINQGDGHFEDATVRSGIDVPGWSASATFVDFDRDGDLDLYVTQYLTFDPSKHCTDLVRRRDYCGPQNFRFLPDILYRNEGTGVFTDVSEEAGIAASAAPGLGVVAEDFDEDGWPDLYIANDGQANQLWRNLGNGRFEDIALSQGIAFNMQGKAEGGMGVVAADFGADGLLDLFVTNLRAETNTLYRNLGADAGYLDVTTGSFPGAPSSPFTGFGIVVFDMELDGDLDLVVANGGVRGSIDELGSQTQMEDHSSLERYAEPNQIFLNDGAGQFALLDDARCGICLSRAVTRGSAIGDLDGDGDLDLVLLNIDRPIEIYENRRSGAESWIGLRALSERSGSDDLGAVIRLSAGGKTQRRTVNASLGYASSSDMRQVFGLAEATTVDDIELRWSDGRSEHFDVDCLDCDVLLHQGEGRSGERP